MVEKATRFFVGDAQARLKGYHGDPGLDLAMPDAGPLLEVIRADPTIADASLRLEDKALASQSDKSHGVAFVGAYPANLAPDLFKAVLDGAALGGRTAGGDLKEMALPRAVVFLIDRSGFGLPRHLAMCYCHGIEFGRNALVAANQGIAVSRYVATASASLIALIALGHLAVFGSRGPGTGSFTFIVDCQRVLVRARLRSFDSLLHRV